MAGPCRSPGRRRCIRGVGQGREAAPHDARLRATIGGGMRDQVRVEAEIIDLNRPAGIDAVHPVKGVLPSPSVVDAPHQRHPPEHRLDLRGPQQPKHQKPQRTLHGFLGAASRACTCDTSGGRSTSAVENSIIPMPANLRMQIW